MTCVPDSLIRKLKNEEYQIIGLDKKPSAKEFMIKMKEHNKDTSNVIWQGSTITETQKKENVERIQNIEIKNIGSGYLCSSFDPLLFLYCELFNVSIDCHFNGTLIKYKNINTSNRVIKFSCSKSHFS